MTELTSYKPFRSGGIYLAAAFRRKAEIAKYAATLRQMGFAIVSTWHDRLDDESDTEEASHEDLRKFAILDLDDLHQADQFILFNGVGRRGGRLVEFGYAVAYQLDIMIVGPKTTIFDHLPGIIHYPEWEDVIDRFVKGKRIWAT